jgi:hypothetical protein
MSKPKPHSAFSYHTPDEVAECWDGVSKALYAKLWSLTELVPPIPNIEDSGPHDHVGHGNLADLWDHLSEDEAITLNELAEKLAEEQYDDRQHG